MFQRVIPAVIVLCLVAVPVRAAEKELSSPGVIVRIQSIDSLIDNVKYLAALAGQEDKAREIEGLLKSKAGPKGLQGIDTKRPLGLYGKIGAQGIDSTGVILLPIADEKAFLDLLGQLNLKADKGDDDVYTTTPEKSPFPVYFRFANQYAYVTAGDKSAIDKGKLLTPAQVMPADDSAVASASIHIDQIPDGLKQIALTQFELQLANAKDKKEPNETPTQHELKGQMLDAMFGRITTVIKDGGELKLHVDLDRKTDELAIELSVAGKPGTKLAAGIAEMSQAKSLFGGLLSSDAAMNVLVHATLPEDVRKALAPALDEGFRKELEKEKDEAKRADAEKVIKAIEPTLKAGEVDAGFSLRGPSKGGHYTVVGGIKLKDGEAIEKVARDVFAKLPEADRAKIKLDAETAGNVKIHRVDAKDLDAKARKTFGENPVYFAFRSDALLLAAGEDGLSALKEALSAQPKATAPVRVELSLAHLASLMAEQQKGAPAAAKAAFANDKDGGKIRLTLQGGKALKVRFDMKASVVKFLSLVEKNEKAEQ